MKKSNKKTTKKALIVKSKITAKKTGKKANTKGIKTTMKKSGPITKKKINAVKKTIPEPYLSAEFLINRYLESTKLITDDMIRQEAYLVYLETGETDTYKNWITAEERLINKNMNK